MTAFISKHPIKITVVAAVAVLVAFLNFGMKVGEVKSQIEVNKAEIVEIKAEFKDDIKEIKTDIKTLLKRK